MSKKFISLKMMKTDASAAEIFWCWKKPFCQIFPLIKKKNSLKFFHILKNTWTGIEQFKVIMALWAYVQRFILPEDCLWIEPLPRKKQNKAKQRKKEKQCHYIKFTLWTHTLRFEALWPLLLIPQIYRVLISGTEQHIADT